MPDYISYTGVCPACSRAVICFDPEVGNKSQCLGCGKWYTIQRIFPDKQVVLFTLPISQLEKKVDKSIPIEDNSDSEPW